MMSLSEFVRSFSSEWWRITLLGEPLMMAPLALVIGMWLWLACPRRIALGWIGLLAVGGGILVAQKLLYYMAGVSLDSIRLFTLSGHSFSAAYFYGSLAAIIALPWPKLPRRAAYVVALLLALAIGVSRVAVAGHRTAEAIGGLLLGVILLACFLRFFWRNAHPKYSGWTLALPCLAVMALTYGRVYEFENIFRALGRWANPGMRFYR